MPTSDPCRREWALEAIDCFLAQTYPNKELIVLDDSTNPTFSYPPGGVKYFAAENGVIGKRRNQCCEFASGDFIAHFDSDDWSCPDRLSIQLEQLERERKAVTGFYSMLFLDVDKNALFAYTRNQLDYALGTSLFYKRSWWLNNPFDEINVGEDYRFVNTALSKAQFIARDGGGLMVARVHFGNTSIKRTERYRAVPLTALPKLFGTCSPFLIAETIWRSPCPSVQPRMNHNTVSEDDDDANAATR